MNIRSKSEPSIVLVVEDNFILATEMKNKLELIGVEVVGPIATVADALRLIKETPVLDAALLDINLRDSKVYPVADALRDLGVPIIFVTGYDLNDIPDTYRDVPRCTKPQHLGQILRALALKDVVPGFKPTLH
jgi:CheY-like chemotaxis protein